MALPKINSLFRLTRDAETQYSAGGTPVVKLGLAASEKYKEKETQCFIDAVAFGKMGEIIAQYAGSKGSQIFLSGKLQLDQWEDNNTGQKRSKHTMVIEGFDFVSGGQQNQQQGQPMQPQQNFQQPQQPMNPQQYKAAQAQGQQRPQQGFTPAPHDFQSDDVPF